jgi:hypothetical protein
VTKKPVTVLAPATKEAAATPSHTEAAVAAVEPLPAPGDDGGDAKASLLQQALDFIARYWLWICVLLALPIAGWLWAWYAHRNAYDEAGLPRGPKL